ncbi:hypothetical protein [Taibaiella koreensis]|uniref:hypothetical protein n=1 Tax=Taibaiella koreensis TaxID=1268548 RepID=UPI000E59DE3A|nr:hypothetical protein [Taibaiella koreensis]
MDGKMNNWQADRATAQENYLMAKDIAYKAYCAELKAVWKTYKGADDEEEALRQWNAGRIKAQENYKKAKDKAHKVYCAELGAAFRIAMKARKGGDSSAIEARLKKCAKLDEHQRMAGEVYKARIEAQKEADALRRAAKGTTDKPSSILD